MTVPAIEIRRAAASDYADIAALLSASVFGALEPAERREGFLQGSFTPDIVHWFDRSAGVFVACDGARIIGVLCACDLGDGRLPPQAEGLRAHLPEWRLDGNPIPLDRTLCYGPVCIDRRYRGRGLLKRLFAALLESAAPAYDYGVAFVSVENPRSLAAHRDGLGMRQLGEYDAGTRVALSFRIPAAAR